MHTRMESRISSSRNWTRWLLYLLFAMVMLGAAAVASSTTLRPAQTTYRIVPLTAGQAILNVDINATGQVVFTESVDGVNRAKFYDGNVVRDIGTLGGPSATAAALNDRGQVAGTASVDAAGTLSHAYRWSRQTGMVDLSRPGQGESSGHDINNRGQVTGGAVFGPANTVDRHAFIWSQDSGMIDIGTLDMAAHGTVINDAGTIAGMTGGDGLRAFRWTARDGMRIITPTSNEFNTANDINAAGNIVGATVFNNTVPVHAYVWTPREGLIDLGTSFPNRTVAEKINDRGMVIGNVRDFTEFPHGFVWTRESGVIEIGAGSPGLATSTADLNELGQVVGSFGDRAYVWTRTQGVVDLNTRLRDAPEGLVLRAGRAISDNGSIVAQANTGLVLLVPTAGSGNAAPVVGPVKLTGPARAGALLSFSAAFKDADLRDTHRARWTWGDGSKDVAIVSERDGAGSVSGQHAYRSPGRYIVTLTVTDSRGTSTTVRRNVMVRRAGPHVAGENG